MLKYPDISPIVFQIGPLALRWYGLMYAIDFLLLLWVMRREQRSGFLPLSDVLIDRLFLLIVVFLILGARVFYAIFYGGGVFLENPLELFAIWHGGMSFHGGLFGVVFSVYLVARKAKLPFVAIGDTMALVAPIALGLGRLGNFMNGELFGRVTAVPWGMVFPRGGPQPRHPSQIYEALLEGLVLAAILWLVRRRVKRYGILTALFLIGYGLARIFVEFFRQPDAQLGFILGPFTMGQLLTVAVLVPGILLFIHSVRKGPVIEELLAERAKNARKKR